MIKNSLKIIVHLINTMATDLNTDSIDALKILADILQGKEVTHDCRGRWLKELSALPPFEYSDDVKLTELINNQIIADEVAKNQMGSILAITNNLDRNQNQTWLFRKLKTAFGGNNTTATIYYDQINDLAKSETEDTDVDFMPGVRGVGGTTSIDEVVITGPQIIGDVLALIQEDYQTNIIPAIQLLVRVLKNEEIDNLPVCRADWLKMLSQILSIETLDDANITEVLANQITTDKFISDNQKDFSRFMSDERDREKTALGDKLFNNLNRELSKDTAVDAKGLDYFTAAVEMRFCRIERDRLGIKPEGWVTSSPMTSTGVTGEAIASTNSNMMLALVPIATVSTFVLVFLALKFTNAAKAITEWPGLRFFKVAEPLTDENDSLLTSQLENAACLRQ
jgi:hypothetical protein